MEAITKDTFQMFKQKDNSDDNAEAEINTLIRLLEKMKTFPASWDADGENLTLILDNIHKIYKRHGKAD
jgi:hypothetical protein